jgi:hypothetical protein
MGMTLSFRVIATVVSIAFAGCASKPELPENAPKPGVRATLRDVSFLPPQETGWLLTGEGPDQKVYANLGRNQDHQFAAVVAFISPPEGAASDQQLMNWVVANRLTGEAKRRRLVDGARDWDTSRREKCIRYRAVIQDYTARNTARAPYLLTTSFGLVCRHPKDASVLTEVVLTERGLPEDVTPQIAEKMSAGFLGSLKFN